MPCCNMSAGELLRGGPSRRVRRSTSSAGFSGKGGGALPEKTTKSPHSSTDPNFPVSELMLGRAIHGLQSVGRGPRVAEVTDMSSLPIRGSGQGSLAPVLGSLGTGAPSGTRCSVPVLWCTSEPSAPGHPETHVTSGVQEHPETHVTSGVFSVGTPLHPWAAVAAGVFSAHPRQMRVQVLAKSARRSPQSRGRACQRTLRTWTRRRRRPPWYPNALLA